LGADQLELNLYFNLGFKYHHIGNFPKAINYTQMALNLAIEIGEEDQIRQCNVNLSAYYNQIGDFRSAIEIANKGILLEEDQTNYNDSFFNHLGIAHCNLGNFRNALEYYEKSLDISIKNDDKASVMKVYTNIGKVYLFLGDYHKVLYFQEKALEINKILQDKRAESRCFTNMGNAYFYQNRFDLSEYCHRKSLNLLLEAKDRGEAPYCYGNLGLALVELGKIDEAIEYFKQGEMAAAETGNQNAEMICILNLGGAFKNLNEADKAKGFFQKAAELNNLIGSIEMDRVICANLGDLASMQEHLPEAFDYYKRAIELSECISDELLLDEHSIGFLSRTSDEFLDIIPICLEMGKSKEAFNFMERGKSAAFRKLLGTTQIIPKCNISKEFQSLLDEENEILANINHFNMRHVKGTGKSWNPAVIDNLRDRLKRIYEEISRFDADYSHIRKGQPITTEQLLDLLKNQRRKVILIEYYILDEEVIIMVFRSGDKRHYVERVKVRKEILHEYIYDNFLQTVLEYKSSIKTENGLRELSRHLISPIEQYLEKDALLYIVPFGALHYLPIHALEVQGTPLIAQYSVAYLPSSSVLLHVKEKGSGEIKNVVSFGVEFEEEAANIAALLGGRVFAGRAATRERFLEICYQFDIIHFSCHGYYNHDAPLQSGIRLFNENLTAQDILGIQLKAELVTLSACETGINKRTNGDELIGLTRSFLFAGAASILVSLWAVDAYATKLFMDEFYGSLSRGKDKATSLQQAQLSLMRKEKYSHPYYWAPFILVGDFE